MSQSYWDCFKVKEGIKQLAVTQKSTGKLATPITSLFAFIVKSVTQGGTVSDPRRLNSWSRSTRLLQSDPIPTRSKMAAYQLYGPSDRFCRERHKASEQVSISVLLPTGVYSGVHPEEERKILKAWAKFNQQLPLLGCELVHLAIWQPFFSLADFTCLSRKQW